MRVPTVGSRCAEPGPERVLPRPAGAPSRPGEKGRKVGFETPREPGGAQPRPCLRVQDLPLNPLGMAEEAGSHPQPGRFTRVLVPAFPVSPPGLWQPRAPRGGTGQRWGSDMSSTAPGWRDTERCVPSLTSHPAQPSFTSVPQVPPALVHPFPAAKKGLKDLFGRWQLLLLEIGIRDPWDHHHLAVWEHSRSAPEPSFPQQPSEDPAAGCQDQSMILKSLGKGDSTGKS